MFQFTRPQGARQCHCRGRCQAVVSIHAPARGATVSRGLPVLKDIVSIHAPARGATTSSSNMASHREFQFTRPQGARRNWHTHPYHQYCFNSRARKGRDLDKEYNQWYKQLVSIHAPARGATSCSISQREEKAFQFTRPQGARRVHPNPHPTVAGFNSRARKGRDTVCFNYTYQWHMFQFTRPQGTDYK